MPNRANPFSQHFFIWKWKPLIPAVLWFLAMSAALLFPSNTLPKPDIGINYADKLVHLFLFGGFTFLLLRYLSSKYYQPRYFFLAASLAICGIVVYAGLVEYLQEHHLQRDGNLPDFIADLAGVALGAFAGIRKYS